MSLQLKGKLITEKFGLMLYSNYTQIHLASSLDKRLANRLKITSPSNYVEGVVFVGLHYVSN